MKHDSIWCTALLASCLLAPAFAQDQATTLLAAVRSADVIVRATVVTAIDPDPQWHRLQFRSDQLLKGTVPGYFSLLEPAGKCCGRSLFALTIGDSRLLFLRRVGPILHPFGGSRGVLPVTPELLAHTAALLAAPDDAALAALLAASLDHAEPRIADDAAHALATLPGLQLSGAGREAVTTALAAAVQRGATRSASLADVAARLADPAMLDAVLPIYLTATRDDQAHVLQSALCRCPASMVADRLPTFVGSDQRANVRAAELLTRLPSAIAMAAMTDMLRRNCHPQVKLHLCEGLLSAGVLQITLTPLVPAPVLELAAQRLQRRRTFRNISPQR